MMEKLSDADLIAAVRICCGPVEYTSCDECPAHEWCEETHTDIMYELEQRLSGLRSCLEDAKNGRLELARKYQTLRAERDDLRKDIAVLTEELTGAHDEVHRLAKSLSIARLQRKQAWDKLARIDGERELAWLEKVRPDWYSRLEGLDYNYDPVKDGTPWYRAEDVWACIEEVVE